MGRTLLTEREDLQWLREVHLPDVPIEDYAAALLIGNEDSPEQIELYRSAATHWASLPDRSYAVDADGTYTRE